MASEKVQELIRKSGGKKYTVDEISEASGYTPETVRRHISEGTLKSVKLGGRRFVPEEDAVKYLKGTPDDP